MRKIVCDAGPVIHLYEARCLHLLRQTGSLFLPSLVWSESGDLHSGESEAIVLARRIKADWFLTDDSATRLFVGLLGIEVHGSLGVILWNAARRNISREETEKALDALEESYLWLSHLIYQEARQALGEIFNPGS